MIEIVGYLTTDPLALDCTVKCTPPPPLLRTGNFSETDLSD